MYPVEVKPPSPRLPPLEEVLPKPPAVVETRAIQFYRAVAPLVPSATSADAGAAAVSVGADGRASTTSVPSASRPPSPSSSVLVEPTPFDDGDVAALATIEVKVMQCTGLLLRLVGGSLLSTTGGGGAAVLTGNKV